MEKKQTIKIQFINDPSATEPSEYPWDIVQQTKIIKNFVEDSGGIQNITEALPLYNTKRATFEKTLNFLEEKNSNNYTLQELKDIIVTANYLDTPTALTKSISMMAKKIINDAKNIEKFKEILELGKDIQNDVGNLLAGHIIKEKGILEALVAKSKDNPTIKIISQDSFKGNDVTKKSEVNVSQDGSFILSLKSDSKFCVKKYTLNSDGTYIHSHNYQPKKNFLINRFSWALLNNNIIGFIVEMLGGPYVFYIVKVLFNNDKPIITSNNVNLPSYKDSLVVPRALIASLDNTSLYIAAKDTVYEYDANTLEYKKVICTLNKDNVSIVKLYIDLGDSQNQNVGLNCIYFENDTFEKELNIQRFELNSKNVAIKKFGLRDVLRIFKDSQGYTYIKNLLPDYLGYNIPYLDFVNLGFDENMFRCIVFYKTNKDIKNNYNLVAISLLPQAVVELINAFNTNRISYYDALYLLKSMDLGWPQKSKELNTLFALYTQNVTTNLKKIVGRTQQTWFERHKTKLYTGLGVAAALGTSYWYYKRTGKLPFQDTASALYRSFISRMQPAFTQPWWAAK